MERTDEKAMRIATALVDRTGLALMADDFETMHRHQILPQPIETFEGRKFVTTTEQMRRIFFSLRSHHKAMNVTQIRREVTTARFVDAENIDTVYFSYLYSGQTLVQEPYPSYAMLRRVEGEWKFAYCMYGVTDMAAHRAALMNVPDEVQRPPGTVGHPS